jgi:hypothetical protein
MHETRAKHLAFRHVDADADGCPHVDLACHVIESIADQVVFAREASRRSRSQRVVGANSGRRLFAVFPFFSRCGSHLEPSARSACVGQTATRFEIVTASVGEQVAPIEELLNDGARSLSARRPSRLLDPMATKHSRLAGVARERSRSNEAHSARPHAPREGLEVGRLALRRASVSSRYGPAPAPFRSASG